MLRLRLPLFLLLPLLILCMLILRTLGWRLRCMRLRGALRLLVRLWRRSLMSLRLRFGATPWFALLLLPGIALIAIALSVNRSHRAQ